MIQRVQSIYLLLAGLLCAAILISTIFIVNDGTSSAFIGVWGVQDGDLDFSVPSLIPIMIVATITAVIDFVAIFQFKNRKKQVLMVRMALLLTLVLMGWMGLVFYQLSTQDLAVTPMSGVFHTVLIFFANILALRGITKDDKLVKSVDRLR